MDTKHNLDCFDEFTAKFIQSKVRRLIGRAGLTESDRPDLIQEFAFDLIQRSKNFDPNTANWEAFVVVVCENKYASILEYCLARKRSRDHETASLNAEFRKSRGRRADLGSTLADNQQDIRTGHRRRSDQEASDLREDVASVLDRMPPLMHKVCEHLMRRSKAATARELGISRTSLYEILRRLLTRFDDAELRDYLR